MVVAGSLPAAAVHNQPVRFPMLRAVPVTLLLALVALFAWQAFQLTGEPAVYPQIVVGLLSVFLLAYLAQEALAGRVGAGFLAEVLPRGRAGILRQAGFLGVWIGYVVVLPHLGFILATWAALTVSGKIAGARSLVRTALIAAVFTLVLAILLKTVLFVPLPRGFLDTRLDTLIFSLT